MKGLEKIPSSTELREAYDALGGAVLTVERLALYSQWVRFDPRLGEIWVGYVGRNWQTLSPATLRAFLQKLPWPAAAALLLEFVRMSLKRSNPGALLAVFRHWARAVSEGSHRSRPPEQFFIGTRALGGAVMRADAEFSHKSYLKWGFLGREILLPKALDDPKTELRPSQRRTILRRLLAQTKRIRVRGYIVACGGAVSVRTAQRDLAAIRLRRPR